MADLLNDGALVDDDQPTSGVAPWHLWAVGVVALLWNSIPTFDATLTLFQVDSWTTNADAATVAKVLDGPIWANLGWLAGGWGGFVGAVLLLLRSRFAPIGFAVSLIGAAVSFAWQFTAGLQSSPVFPTIVLASEAFFWWYASRMRAEEVLR